jgi:hypothetical protein
MVIIFDLLLVKLLGFLLLLMQPQHFLFLEFPFGVLVFNVLLLPLEIVYLCDQLFVLAHDALVISLVELNIFLELFLEAFHCGLEVRSFFDELFLLVDALHLLFAFFLNILTVYFYDLGFQPFIVLNQSKLTLM